MGWTLVANLAIAGINIVASYLLRATPESKTRERDPSSDLKDPQADAHKVIPAPFGTVCIEDPLILHYNKKSKLDYEVDIED